MKTKEITLSELLSTDFIIVDNKMLGTLTLDRINMISDVLKQQKEEIEKLNNIIKEAIKYINTFEDIKAYFSYVECGYEEYNYNDNFKKELLSILRGEE